MTNVFEVTVKMYVHVDDQKEKHLDERDGFVTSREYVDEVVDNTLHEINYNSAMTGHPIRTSKVIETKVVDKATMESNLYTTEYDKKAV